MAGQKRRFSHGRCRTSCVHHFSGASSDRVRLATSMGISALVLELCEERLLPILCCPNKHRGAWLTATLPSILPAHVGADLWHRFALDQQYAMALRDGAEMQDALLAVCEARLSSQLPLVVLADVQQSQRSTDDRSRDELLARAAAAAVLLGHQKVLLVIGQDHVDEVARALSASAEISEVSELDVRELHRNPSPNLGSGSSSATIDSLEVPLGMGGTRAARALFLGPSAVEMMLKRQEELSKLCQPTRLEHRMGRASAELAEVVQKFGLLSGLLGNDSFVSDLVGAGAALRPTCLSELAQWHSSVQANGKTP